MELAGITNTVHVGNSRKFARCESACETGDVVRCQPYCGTAPVPIRSKKGARILVQREAGEISTLYPSRLSPPPDLLRGATLLLDLDGTLLDLVDRPEQVCADEPLIELIRRLRRFLDGRLAVISGRSLQQIDGILGEVAAELALSGSHGSEHRWQGLEARPERPPALDQAAERLRPFVAATPGTLLEEKSFGVALHYRMAPNAEAAAHDLALAVADELGLAVQRGKMMVELRVPGGDKGKAVARLMRQAPMRGTTPIFVGDDVTDEAGFAAAAEWGGCGILVGPDRPTAARYRIESPAALRAWLHDASA